MDKPIPNNFLNDLKPYKGGASSINGVDKIFKLSSNETPAQDLLTNGII